MKECEKEEGGGGGVKISLRSVRYVPIEPAEGGDAEPGWCVNRTGVPRRCRASRQSYAGTSREKASAVWLLGEDRERSWNLERPSTGSSGSAAAPVICDRSVWHASQIEQGDPFGGWGGREGGWGVVRSRTVAPPPSSLPGLYLYPSVRGRETQHADATVSRLVPVSPPLPLPSQSPFPPPPAPSPLKRGGVARCRHWPCCTASISRAGYSQTAGRSRYTELRPRVGPSPKWTGAKW